MRGFAISGVFFKLALCSLVISCSMESSLTPLNYKNIDHKSDLSLQVIYGEDNRKDWFEVVDPRLLELAQSTAGLMDKAEITVGENSASITSSEYELCPEEAFSDQKTSTWCSGFLVGPDLMVTAGHCIEYDKNCTNIAVVFGYANKTASNDPTLIDPDDVYTCKTVVKRRESFSSADWAVIQLDRPVVGRAPLKIRRAGTVELNTPLFYIGHPSGLPSKISGGGTVLEIQRRYFKTDLDASMGASGSAVFNAQTLEVEGVISRGKDDYIYDKKRECLMSNVCEQGLDGYCTAPVVEDSDSEHITKITEALSLIPETIITPPEEDTGDEGENKEDAPNTYYSGGPYKIRDNSLKITVSTIKDVPEITDIEQLKINMSIKHPYISDLSVKLTAPNGKNIFLHKRTGETKKDIIGVYGADLNSYQKLSLIGTQQKGNWQLEVKDHAPYDEGQLIKWSIAL